jgi:hypothetical protein
MTVVTETQPVGIRNSAQRRIAISDTILEAVVADVAMEQCREVTYNFPSLSKRVLMSITSRKYVAELCDYYCTIPLNISG